MRIKKMKDNNQKKGESNYTPVGPEWAYHLFYVVSLLPFRLLYFLSDVLAFLIYHIVRYRRKVVRSNLTTSFPEKDKKEIKSIEKRFYRWLCDYFVEAIKLLTINEDELNRRFTITNSNEIEDCFEHGQNVAAILGHYCNWEWLSCVGKDLPANRKVGLVYHPLRSDAFDELFKRIRSHEANGEPVKKKDILRLLITYKQNGIMNIFGYISDQVPQWRNIHLWLPFLNHDTPVFTGGEKIMRKMNNAVYYAELTRPRRGYYSLTYRLITKDPKSLPEFEITRRFFKMLEETIRREPAYYLWTHNRWKRTHEEFNRRFEIVNEKVVPKKEEDE